MLTSRLYSTLVVVSSQDVWSLCCKASYTTADRNIFNSEHGLFAPLNLLSIYLVHNVVTSLVRLTVGDVFTVVKSRSTIEVAHFR